MMYLSVIFLILTLLADGILGLVVWLQASRKKVNIVFALLTLSFIVWSASGFYDQTASGSDPLLPIMAGVPFIAGIFMAYFITLFSLYFPEFYPSSPRTRRITLWLLHVTTVPLLGIFVFDLKLMVADITTSAAQGNNIVVGPLYGLFFLYFIAWISVGLINLIYKFKHLKERVVRLQLSYIFTGVLAMTAVTVLTNVVLPVLAHNPAPARFGFLSTLFILGFVGYAVAAHRLFNIRPLIARSVAYVLLLATLTGLYGLGMLGITSTFFSNNIPLVQAGAFIALALFIGFTLQPLRLYFNKLTDRIFYHDRYNAQAVLNNISNVLASEILIEPVLKGSLEHICSDLRISGGELIVLDGEKIYKRAQYGRRPDKTIIVDDLMLLRPGALVRDELPPSPRAEIMHMYEIGASLELQTNEGLIGFLILGDKLSGEVYSTQDLQVLEIARKGLAVAVVNARAYEQIARFNETLQDRVHSATQRLRSANRNLKTLDKAKDDFISVASHQLGTPLTAINGYLSMALDDDRGNMTIQQREYISFAMEASERMVAMSSDLLNVSRLNAGRFMIQTQEVDLTRLTEQEVQQLQPSAERKKLQLIFHRPPTPLPHIMLDESKTRQVIMNFIDNAIYYTETGSITVELKADDNHVQLTVTDSGIGVPATEQAHLFAKFYRAANARVARPDGTGLGLYLAKRVIEDQNGQLIFNSTEGHGSTFGFSLPIKLAAPALSATKAK